DRRDVLREPFLDRSGVPRKLVEQAPLRTRDAGQQCASPQIELLIEPELEARELLVEPGLEAHELLVELGLEARELFLQLAACHGRGHIDGAVHAITSRSGARS